MPPTVSHRAIASVFAIFPLAVPTARSATTWEGDAGTSWATVGGWSDGLPSDAEAVFIKNSTTSSSLVLDAAHRIGTLSFGDTGTRITPFEIQARDSPLTHAGGGLVANGNFAAGTIGLNLRGHHIIQGDQTWTIAGSAGSPTSDSGVVFRAGEDSLAPGSVTLEGDLNRTGGGQLMYMGVSIGGAGDVVIGDSGSLKFNAGAGLPISSSQGGSFFVNGGSLFTSQNSGSFENFNRGIVMNAPLAISHGSVWKHEQALSGVASIGSAIEWNTADASFIHELTAGTNANLRLTGPWSGKATVVATSNGALTLAGASQNFAGTLSFGQNGSIAGNGSLNIDGAFGGTLLCSGGLVNLNAPVVADVEVYGGVLRVNQTLSGDLLAEGPGVVKFAADLDGDLTLDATTAWFDPSAAAPVQPTSFTLATTAISNVVLSKLPAAAGTYPLIRYPEKTIDLTKLALAGGSAKYRGPASKFSVVDLGALNEIRVAVAPVAINWTRASNGNWDVDGTSNWSGTGNKFFHLDTVTFSDDGDGTVTLVGTLYPGLINLTNSTGNNYTFSGSGALSGCASINKTGTGTVTLGGANDFTGSISVLNGLLKMGSAGAFGHSSGITVASGGQVDLNGQSPAQDPARSYYYKIAGTGLSGQSAANQGAIVNTNSSNTIQGAAGVQSLELTGDALISSSMGGRFDIGFSNAAGFGILKGAGHILTVKAKDKPSEPPLNNYGMPFRANGLDTIHIVAADGVIWAENNPTAFGGPGSSLRVKNGAKAGTFGRLALAVPVFLEGGATLYNQGNGTGTWGGTITLEGNAAIEADGRRVVVNGPVVQSGINRNLAKTGDNTLVLAGACTYSGTTTVSKGTLLVNGSLGTGAVSVPAGSTLGGNGTIGGNVTISGNALLSPGESVGNLRCNGTATFATDAQYVWEINDWNGNLPGTNWDLFRAGLIDLDATSGDPLNIRITGVPANYSVTAKTFVIASSDQVITGFNAAAITALSPSLGSPADWTFGLSADGKSILMHYLGGTQPPATPFSTWAATAHQLQGNDALAGADPDRDGIPNIVEFAFDGNPKSGANSRKIVGKIVSLSGQQVLTLTLPVRKGTSATFTGTTSLAAVRDGVSYRIEGSDQLAAWNLDVDEITGTSATMIRTGLNLPPLSTADWEYRTFRSPGAVAGDPRDFLRAWADVAP